MMQNHFVQTAHDPKVTNQSWFHVLLCATLEMGCYEVSKSFSLYSLK